jgi:hypothetical protein
VGSRFELLSAIRKKQMGFNKAAKDFNVPKTSLQKYIHMKSKTWKKAIHTKLWMNMVFSQTVDEELIDYCL